MTFSWDNLWTTRITNQKKVTSPSFFTEEDISDSKVYYEKFSVSAGSEQKQKDHKRERVFAIQSLPLR